MTATRTLSKVPEVTVWFWIVKALTTALGESVSDFLVHAISPVPAVLAGFAGFVIALVVQFRADRYNAWTYWTAVAMVGIFGTMAADVLHVGFGVPYALSAALFLVALAVVFTAWQRSEGTLSIHSITTPRRELFYWAAVVATFALGTAAGDLVANSLALGYLPAAIGFGALILVPAAAFRWFGLGSIPAFWIAYVLTRPLGASVADWLGKPTGQHGVGVGSGPVSLVLAVAIVVLVAYLAVTRVDQAPRAPRQDDPLDATAGR